MFKIRNLLIDLISKSRIFIENLSDEYRVYVFSQKNAPAFFIGLFVFVLGILFLEIFNQPYFFTQDDGFQEFLPTMIYGCKSFFEHGILAEINPFQFCCVPLAAVGTSALLYPITYISYLIAKYIFLTEYAMMDVFVITHLFIAYTASYFAARSCGVKKYLSVIFALSYVFSGYSLIVGRSWPTVSPTIAYSPFIILSLNSVIKNKQNFFWAIWTGEILGLLFLAGHIQMWIYTMMFFVFLFFVAFLSRKITFKQLLGIIYPILICFMIIMPQLYVEFDLFEGLQRGIQVHYWPELKNCLLSMFLPTHFFNDSFSNGHLLEIKTIAFSGGIFSLIYVFILLNLFFQKGKIILKFLKNNPYFILGFIAFWFSLSDTWGVFPIVHKLLFLTGFKWAHKLIIFMNLFLNLSVVIILSKLTISKSRKFKVVFSSGMLILLFFHLFFSNSAFCKYSIKPYPKVNYNNEQVISDIKHHRFFSFSSYLSDSSTSIIALKMNFPTIYNIYSYGGYQDCLSNYIKYNIIGKISQETKYIKEYGVKYLVFQKLYNNKNDCDIDYGKLIIENDIEKNFNGLFKKIYNNDGVIVYDIGYCKPLAFVKGTKHNLPIEFNACGAVIDVSEIKEKENLVVANMMYYPNYRIFTEKGFEVAKTNDEYNRLVIFSPKLNNKLIIKYKSPWYKGSLISLCLIILSIVMYLLQLKVLRRYKSL